MSEKLEMALRTGFMNTKARTKKQKRRRALNDTVHLIAYDREGKAVLEEFLSVLAFQEESHRVLDESAFREACRIVRLRGAIHDETGGILEEFAVCYDQTGFMVRDGARLANGTILGAWEELTR